MSNSPLILEDVSHRFGSPAGRLNALEVLRGISLRIEREEFVAVVGPSGCGKTTLLSLMSGYVRPEGGVVRRHGGVRTVFQQGGLFPWMTAAENIALGLRHVRDAAERRRRLGDMLDFIRLNGFAGHYPRQLSGGMAQRVELARALAADADILLMDEPFSSLDYVTRLQMRHELARMLKDRPRTVVLVTHDIEEAAQLADRVVVLSERPAVIRCERRIDVPRPRSLTHPMVVEAVRRILTEMGLEEPGAVEAASGRAGRRENGE